MGRAAGRGWLWIGGLCMLRGLGCLPGKGTRSFRWGKGNGVGGQGEGEGMMDESWSRLESARWEGGDDLSVAEGVELVPWLGLSKAADRIRALLAS